MSRKRWRKSWEEKWRDEAADMLGFEARALRALLGDVAELEDGSDAGWAIDSRGLPFTRDRLARLLAATPAQVDAAVEQLLNAGVLVVDQRGRLGLLDWRRSQEDPSAERQRRRRGLDRDADREHPVTSGVTVTPDVTPISRPEEQRTEDRGQNPESSDPPAGARGSAPPPPRTLGQRIQATRTLVGLTIRTVAQRATARGVPIGDALLRRIEADEAQPTRVELEALAREIGDSSLAQVEIPETDPTVAEQVAVALHAQRAEFGIEEPRPVVDGNTIREVFAPEPWLRDGLSLLDAWLVVIRRAGEEHRRNVEDNRSNRDLQFMDLRSLGGDQRWRRYLAATDLDRRREPRQRGAPGGHVVARAGRKYTSGGKL